MKCLGHLRYDSNLFTDEIVRQTYYEYKLIRQTYKDLAFTGKLMEKLIFQYSERFFRLGASLEDYKLAIN